MNKSSCRLPVRAAEVLDTAASDIDPSAIEIKKETKGRR